MKRALFLLMVPAALAIGGCATPFDLEGHRGARGLAPENTLPAFGRALEIGVTTLELDVAVTRDGVVVVSHDPFLNPDLVRGADGRWLEARGPNIHDLSFEELSRYDIGRLKPGTAYAKSFPEQVAVDGTRFPRLSEVFDLVRRSGDRWVRFNIETKISPLAPAETLEADSFARALIAEIRRARMTSRSMIQSFDWRTLLVVQREAPEIETVYLTAQRPGFDNVCSGAAAKNPDGDLSSCDPSPWTGGLRVKDYGSVPRMVKAAGGSVWSPNFNDVDAARIEEAHKLGLRVVVWTVNAPDAIRRMLDLGVDGIISDRPDLVKQLAKQ
jgi:glycerophosphoryl diester phosphodiesterase